MDIREHTRAFAIKSDAMGALSLLATLAVYAAALVTGGVLAGTPWVSGPMVVVLAFASVRLYVLQHDCGHYSLFATKWMNDVAGYVLSIFSLTPFRVMQYNHNLHHAYLGNLEHRETTEVYTMTLREWQAAPMARGCGTASTATRWSCSRWGDLHLFHRLSLAAQHPQGGGRGRDWRTT